MSRKCYRCDKLLTRLEEKSEDATFKLEDGLKFPTVHSRCYLCILKSQVRSWELKDEEKDYSFKSSKFAQQLPMPSFPKTDFEEYLDKSGQAVIGAFGIDPICV